MGVLRIWTARATPENARRYAAYFEQVLRPQLSAITGFLGADVRIDPEGGVRVITRWESMAAIARFAGEPVDRAVVEPEARALLLAFEDTVIHTHES